jgi:uncharacterized protein (TIGR00369 family)
MSAPKRNNRKAEEFLAWHGFNCLLGFELVRTHADGLTIQCRVRPELLNSAGSLHGGVAATLADAAVGTALQVHFEGKRRFTTIEMKVNYFRPVREGRLLARARLVRVGSSVCVGQVDLTDQGRRSVGIAIVTYMLLDPPAKPA